MHTAFILFALLLSAAVSGLGALLLRSVAPGGRRSLALAVLSAPAFVLGMTVLHLMPRFWEGCALLAGWDQLVSLVLLIALAIVTAAALALNLTRLVLVERLLAACPPLLDEDIKQRTAAFAGMLKVNPPDMRVLTTDAPLALSGGVRRPVIVLSSWLIEHLDARELDAVLAHELAHVVRRDSHIRWFARILRDATFYLPGSWHARTVLEADQELRADGLAIELTQRPLALANALAKVWRQAVVFGRQPKLADLHDGWSPAVAGASPTLLEERLGRLLSNQLAQSPSLTGRLLAGVSLLSVGGLAPRALAATATLLPLICHMPVL